MLDALTKETFEQLLGQSFDVALASGETLRLTLLHVREAMAGGIGSPHRTPFSLLFRGGPRDQYLPQRIYDLVHPELGTLSIFIVPVGPDEGAMRYEAVFT